jgi:Tfp pilus assembly protein PilF
MPNPKSESIRGLMLLFAILLLVCGASAQSNRSTISGFVFDNSRRPVPEVIVELKSDFSTVGRVRTDSAGKFFFRGLGQGRYTIVALPFGKPFMEHSEEVEIAGMGVGGRLVSDNVQRDIYLQPRRGADAVPFKAEVVFAQEVPKEAENLYKRAVEDLEGKRTQSGIDGLEKAVAVFPTYFMALQKLAMIRLTQEKYDDAAAVFSKAVLINDRCFDCWYGISYARYTSRRFPESVTASIKAVELKADSIEANLLLGMSYRMTKEFDRAERSMKKASKIAEGTSGEVHWQLALLYGKDMNKFEEAAKELESYLKIESDAPNKEEIKKLIKQFRDRSKS